jgi:glycosyltransferase involved in cell wall biosynthesis
VRICLVNVVLDEALLVPETIFERYWHPVALAGALAEMGHDVTMLQAAPLTATTTTGDIRVRLVREDEMTRSGGGYRFPRNPRQTLATLAEERPAVVHFFGLTLHAPLRHVADFCRVRRTPLTVSYHGGLPARHPLRRLRQRRALSGVSRFIFTTHFHAQPWLDARVIADSARVAEIMEVSSPFRGLPRAQARQRLGLTGDPVFVWSGRLCSLKDPLTALRGFARIAGSWKESRLYMAFATDELRSEVQQFIAEEGLGGHVKLLGRLPHRDMEALFSGGEFFLQASHREWGGNSLLEAMSCGAIPVVTDIPSFRAITSAGRFGRLFPIGDDHALAASVTALEPTEIQQLGASIRKHFQQNLSYPALARSYERLFSAAGSEFSGR